MDIRAFVFALRSRGIWFDVEGDRIIVRPSGSLTSDEAQMIRANKPEALAYLVESGPQRRRRPFQPLCATCGHPLDARSAVRCPDCVAAAYRARDERRDQRRQEGV